MTGGCNVACCSLGRSDPWDLKKVEFSSEECDASCCRALAGLQATSLGRCCSCGGSGDFTLDQMVRRDIQRAPDISRNGFFFENRGTPRMDGFSWKKQQYIKMDDLGGTPYFKKPTHGHCFISASMQPLFCATCQGNMTHRLRTSWKTNGFVPPSGHNAIFQTWDDKR